MSILRPSIKTGRNILAIVGALTLSTAGVATASVHQRSSSRRKSSSTAITLRGTVISKELARHAIAIASAAGVVHTLRFRSSVAVRRLAIGMKLVTRTSLLTDGTYKALKVRHVGSASRTKVRGVVIGSTSHRLLLAAGGSNFVISRTSRSSSKLTNGAFAHVANAAGTVSTGTSVQVEADVQGSTLQQAALQSLGQASIIDLEGVLNAISATQIVVAVNNGALTTISIPASLTLPSTIATGDRVEVLAAYANQAFSLVSITDDSLAAASAQASGVSQSGMVTSSTIEAEGIVSAINLPSPTSTGSSSETIVIQPGDNSAAVTFTVPTSFNLTGVSNGDQVHAVGNSANGVLTLSSITVQQPEGEQGASSGQTATSSSTGSSSTGSSSTDTSSSTGSSSTDTSSSTGSSSTGSSTSTGSSSNSSSSDSSSGSSSTTPTLTTTSTSNSTSSSNSSSGDHSSSSTDN